MVPSQTDSYITKPTSSASANFLSPTLEPSPLNPAADMDSRIPLHQRPPHLRARTTPVSSLHKLLTKQEAINAHRGRRSGGSGASTALCKYYELSPWQQDNVYITGGYRPASDSYAACFQSLFYLHNQFVNIHTHLLGSFLFLGTALSLCYLHAEHLTVGDVRAFACFFLGAVTCLGTSATFHAVSSHSPDVARWGNQLDYVGIVGLIVGSFVPSIYYGFYCEPVLQRVYWGMILSIGLACTIVSIRPTFRTPKWRPFRASMFVAMGLSALFPVAHGLHRYGAAQLNRSMGLTWLLLQGLLYVVGAAIYALRVPERFGPGRFDTWGASHQIFHVLIVLAAMAHLVGLLVAFEHNKTGLVCSAN